MTHRAASSALYRVPHDEVLSTKSHVAHILPKLGVRDRVQAVVRAYESGIIQVGAR